MREGGFQEGGELGRGDDAPRPTHAPVPGDLHGERDRILHQWSTVPRRVLYAGSHRKGGPRAPRRLQGIRGLHRDRRLRAWRTFGCDGQPGTLADIDVTDCLLLVGHNVAATDTVMWMRVLDRLAGPRPPKLVVIDPRRSDTAARADVWLAPTVGTNVALLNGLLHLLIRNGHVDRDFIDRHTLGFKELSATVTDYPPARVQQITGVDPALLESAARLIGEAPSLLSTCLQGIYQSHQATAAACQDETVHNLKRLMHARSFDVHFLEAFAELS